MEAFNNFSEIARAFGPVLEQFISTTGDKAVAHIKEHIEANGQVVTGNMLHSVHTEPIDSESTNVVVGADYAAYPNYGTRYQPAKPFFEPGLLDTQTGMEDDLLNITREIGMF